jgi:glycosyltransferase involved in cell wall biosynthesis
VFDACKDRSLEIAEAYLKKCPYEHKFLFADDRFEIFCNNLALEYANGEYIIFIQDDNWMFDKNWDEMLVQVIENTKDIGAIGLLAGLKMLPSSLYSGNYRLNNFFRKIKNILIKNNIKKDANENWGSLNYERIEINRFHKGDKFFDFKLKPFDFGVWQVDAIIRPFCVSVSLIKDIGGLDKAYMPSCGDDMDLSIKLLLNKYKNIYIPFDVLNTSGSSSTMDSQFINNVYENAYKTLFLRYGKIFSSEWNSMTQFLTPIDILKDGSLFINKTDNLELEKNRG